MWRHLRRWAQQFASIERLIVTLLPPIMAVYLPPTTEMYMVLLPEARSSLWIWISVLYNRLLFTILDRITSASYSYKLNLCLSLPERAYSRAWQILQYENTNNEACIAFIGSNLILANTEIFIHSLFYSLHVESCDFLSDYMVWIESRLTTSM